MEGGHSDIYQYAGISNIRKCKTNQNSEKYRNHEGKGEKLRRQMHGNYNELQQKQK